MEQMNAAQQILSKLGVPVGQGVKQAHGNENPSATKSGPGRFARAGHQKDSAPLSRGRVSTSEGRQRTYATLMAHFASKRLSKPGNKRGLGLH